VWSFVVDLGTKFLCVLTIICIFTRIRRIPLAHLFAKHQQIFGNADQIDPDRGFNAGRGQRARQRHPVSGPGRPRGVDARPQIWRFAIRQIRTLAAPDGQHGVLQHATFTIPNYRDGDCTDDNQDDCWASGEGIKLPCRRLEQAARIGRQDRKTRFIEAAGLGM
jgi:hypothetical protein